MELKDIQLPESMKRAMARQAEAEREKRAKIINAEGEALAAAALGDASDIMMAHPLALQLRNLQSLVEIGVDKNTTVVFPAPLMSTIGELGSFLAREPPPRRCRQWSATGTRPRCCPETKREADRIRNELEAQPASDTSARQSDPVRRLLAGSGRAAPPASTGAAGRCWRQ